MTGYDETRLAVSRSRNTTYTFTKVSTKKSSKMSNNLCDLDGRGRDWLDAISLYLNTESVQDRVLVSQAADVSTEGTVQGDALGLGSAPQYQEGPAATYMTKPVMHHPIVTPTATTTTLPVYEKHHMAPGTTQLPHYASPFYLKTTGCSLTPHDDFSLSSSSTCYFDVGPADAVPDGCISSFHG